MRTKNNSVFGHFSRSVSFFAYLPQAFLNSYFEFNLKFLEIEKVEFMNFLWVSNSKLCWSGFFWNLVFLLILWYSSHMIKNTFSQILKNTTANYIYFSKTMSFWPIKINPKDPYLIILTSKFVVSRYTEWKLNQDLSFVTQI